MKLIIKLSKYFISILTVLTLGFAMNIYSKPNPDIIYNYDPGDSVQPDTSSHSFKEDIIDSIIKLGKTFLGLPYKYAGHSPEGFDCSGYVSYLFSQYGYTLPTSSSAMAYVGTDLPYEQARKGDLILFKGRNVNASRVGHVALIIDVDSLGITMMHSNNRGVTIDRYPQMEYYKTRFIGIRRLDL